jgi:GAF domain-containing protein
VDDPDVPAVLRETCRELVELTDASACMLSRVIGELLIEVAEYSAVGKDLNLGHGYLIADFPLTQEVIELKEPRGVTLLDPDAEPNEAKLLRELGFDALLMLPLVSGEECWGLVELYDRGGRRFGDEDARRVAPVLDRVARTLAGA